MTKSNSLPMHRHVIQEQFMHMKQRPIHSISSFLQFYRVGNIERRRRRSSLIITASRSRKHMHIIFIKIIMCSGRTQPINLILNKSKLLRYSVVGRIQKDNRTIMCGCNNNNFILNIRNYIKFSSP